MWGMSSRFDQSCDLGHVRLFRITCLAAGIGVITWIAVILVITGIEETDSVTNIAHFSLLISQSRILFLHPHRSTLMHANSNCNNTMMRNF